MKNIFLTLALLLTVSFAFAKTTNMTVLNTITTENIKTNNLPTIYVISALKLDTKAEYLPTYYQNIKTTESKGIYNSHYINITSNIKGNVFNMQSEVDCTIDIDITIWYPGAPGPVRIKGKFTIHGQSCIDFLKGLTKGAK